MCGQTFVDSVASLANDNYPIYDENKECNVQIRVKSGFIIKAFLLDLFIK